jgi:hypothetical protein
MRFFQAAVRGFWILPLLFILPLANALAADKVNLIYTARVMSQAYPWIAHEAGLFKKYDLDVPMVFVTPGAPSVAAILSGDSEVAVIGAASITRPWVQGNKDPVFVGGIKSLLTHSVIAKPDIKRPEQLKGKRIGVSRIGRQQPALFRRAGVAPLQHRSARSELHPSRRRAGDAGGAGRSRDRCRRADRAHRCAGAQARLSLRRLRPRLEDRLRGDDVHHAPHDRRQASSGDRPLHARDGGSGENHAHGHTRSWRNICASTIANC